MNFKRVAAAAAIAAGVGMSTLTNGIALVSAAPSDPPPGVPGRPAGACWAGTGHPSRKMLAVRAFRGWKPPRRRRTAGFLAAVRRPHLIKRPSAWPTR